MDDTYYIMIFTIFTALFGVEMLAIVGSVIIEVPLYAGLSCRGLLKQMN